MPSLPFLRGILRWFGRAVLWGLLALLLIAAARPGEMLGGALGRIEARFSPEYDPWMILAQYMSGRGLVVPAGYELVLPIPEAGKVAWEAAGTVDLTGRPDGTGGGTLLSIDVCGGEDGGGLSARLSSFPAVPSALLFPTAEPSASWRSIPLDSAAFPIAVRIAGDAGAIALGVGAAMHRVEGCPRGPVRFRVIPRAGHAVLAGWTRSAPSGTWRQSDLAKWPAGALGLALVAGIWTALGRLRPRARVAGALRALARRWRRMELWLGSTALRRWVAAGVLALFMPAVHMLGGEDGAEWVEELPDRIGASVGGPARLDLSERNPSDLMLTARNASEPGALCDIAFRRHVEEVRVYLGRELAPISWLAVPLAGGSIARDEAPSASTRTDPASGERLELEVNGARAVLVVGGVERARDEDLPVRDGSVWLVARSGTCALDAPRLVGSHPAADLPDLLAPWALWIGGWTLLLVLGRGRREPAWITIRHALRATAALALLAWVGMRWIPRALALGPGIGAAAAARRLTGWRAAIAAVAAVALLEVGLGGLDAIQRARRVAQIPPQEFLLHHTAIGGAGWFRYARVLDRMGGYAPRGVRDTSVSRILCLGGSSTEGSGASGPEQAYPAVLERRLAERLGKGRVEVVNAGGGSYTSLQARLIVETEIDEWDPDLVVVSLGHNDCMNDGQPSGLYRYPRPGVRPLNRLLHRSNLVLVLRDAVLTGYRWTSAVAGAIARTPRIDPNGFREHLAETVTRSRAAGADVLLVVEARIDRILAREGQGTDGCSAYVDAIERLNRDLGVRVLDPAAGWSLGEAAELFIDDVHFGDRGYALLAQEIAAVIERDRLLDAFPDPAQAAPGS